MHRVVVRLLVATLLVAQAALVLPAPTLAAASFRTTAFPVSVLPVAQLPYAAGSIPAGPPSSRYHDSAGIPMQMIDGRRVYKPAGLAQLGIKYVEAYRRTQDPMHLEWADKIARTLERIAKASLGGRYIPYRMTFAMHGNPADLMRNPWYSGMAQGLQLSLLVRLSETTGNGEYLTMARPYWNSIRHIGRGSTPWVSWIDAGRYLWIEEYPQARPEHTLNGFMFAIFGLYDYWRVTDDAEVLRFLRGTLTTLKAFILKYRNPGGPADYCLKHGKAQPKYHGVVTWQLRSVALISGDAYFRRVANLFARDYVYRP